MKHSVSKWVVATAVTTASLVAATPAPTTEAVTGSHAKAACAQVSEAWSKGTYKHALQYDKAQTAPRLLIVEASQNANWKQAPQKLLLPRRTLA